MQKKLKPEKIQKIYCPKCKELQAKVYPWSNLTINPAAALPICKRCINSTLKAGVA